MKRGFLFLSAVFLAASVHGVEVAWTYTPPFGFVDASPAAGDLDGDGRTEIVAGTTTGLVIALDDAGGERWRYDLQGPASVPPTIGDITGADGLEVLVMSAQGQIACLTGSTGKELWRTALPGKLQWGETVLALGDLEGDGAIEIVTGDSEGRVFCFENTGELRWTFAGKHGMTYAPSLADLDGDGRTEILAGGDRIPLVCLSFEGKELWELEGGIGGSPLVHDLDEDGSPEILAASGNHLLAVDAKGKVLWRVSMQREMDSAMSVADADGDGEVEIYVADLAGHFVSLSPKGTVHWSANVVERVRRSPSIGDVDGDGTNEILVAGYGGALFVFEPDGRLKERVPLSGGANATATLVPMQGGGLLVVLPTAAQPVQAFRWSGTPGEAAVLWPQYRYDARRNGAPATADAGPALVLTTNFGEMYAGANHFVASVENPGRRTLTLHLEASRNQGKASTSTLVSSEEYIEHTLSYIVPVDQAVNLTLNCTVLEGERAVARRSQTAFLVPLAKELSDATGALAETQELLPELLDDAGPKERAHYLEAQVEALRARTLAAGGLPENKRIELREELSGVLGEVKELRELVKAASHAASANSTIVLAAANPWAPFGGLAEFAEGRVATSEMTVEACIGETESAALNVFNLSSRSRTFRVIVEGLSAATETAPIHERVSLHEVLDVPTEMRDFSADALPRLNSANVVQVSAWGARQIWLNIRTDGLAPGDWTGTVRLRSLDVEPVEASAALKLTLWPVQMPAEQALQLCHWGYVHSSMLKDFPEEALADQVRNGTNVFVGLFFPQATYDEQGNLVGNIDFAAHDAYVRAHAPHGMILFCGYQSALQGPGGIESEAYAKAHVQWLRKWVEHLQSLGLGYEKYALYPVDEPGLSDGLVERYLQLAKLARAADPKIQLYTDPVGRITEAELREMLPYVDIWCPNRTGFFLETVNAAKLDIILNSGKTVWTYECLHNAKHQSPLGYYRAQAWLAWQYGMTGIGFWSYCTSQDDPWFLPGLRHDYLMVYPGQGVVTSKRWEAVRDGVEDYTLLRLLRQTLEAPSAKAKPEDVEAARHLLKQGAATIAAFCGLDNGGTVPGAGGLSEARTLTDQRWQAIQEMRREIAARLAGLK